MNNFDIGRNIEKQNVEPRTTLPEDVDDIIHYIDALNYGIERAMDFPFSLRFIRELHFAEDESPVKQDK